MENEVLFINAATLRAGGGKSVGVNFLKTIGKNYHNRKFVAIVPDLNDYRKIDFDNIILYFVPKLFHKPVFRILLDYWILKKLKKTNSDKVFNMGNIALPSGKYKQITLFHFPYAVYPESKIWKKMTMKDYIVSKLMVFLFKSRLKFSDFLFAQTKTIKNRLIRLYSLEENNIFIAPNAISIENMNKEILYDKLLAEKVSDDNSYKCLCLSVYYPHKNIEILVDVAKMIKEKDLDIKIYLTLSGNNNSKEKKIFKDIEKYELEDILINLGYVEMDKIGFLYSKIDALLLPTLLESFSGTYVESMYFKKKIITSDMDFSREICKNNTWFFNPEDAEDILEKIIESKNINSIEAEEKAYKDVLEMNDWNQTADEIMEVIDLKL